MAPVAPTALVLRLLLEGQSSGRPLQLSASAGSLSASVSSEREKRFYEHCCLRTLVGVVSDTPVTWRHSVLLVFSGRLQAPSGCSVRESARV